MASHEKDERAWAQFAAYDPLHYTQVRLDKLAAVGMYRLSKSGLDCTFDNIVVALHRLFPEKFSLLSFPEYPDSIRVDNTLRLDCKHSQYLQGNRTKGFSLTELGSMAAQDTLKELEGQSLRIHAEVPSSGERRNRATLLTREVRESDAYRKFQSGDQLTRFDVCDVLHGSLDTDDRRLKRNLQTLQAFAKLLLPLKEYNDLGASVMTFLDFVESNWEKVMHGK
jgi:hypothetical protein